MVTKVDHIPKVSRDDVLRIVRRDFQVRERDKVFKLLEAYGSEKGHQESHRVHLAILKLSAGKLDRVRQNVEAAKCDFRDVIGPAEYPRFMELGFVGVDKMSRAEVRALKEDDWQQYETWLQRGHVADDEKKG